MSIFKLNKDFFETTQLELNPNKEFVSSSFGVTGSVDLYSGKSSKIIDLKYDSNYTNSLESSLRNGIDEYLTEIKNSGSHNRKFFKSITLNTPGKFIKGGSINNTPDYESKNSYFKKTLENLNDFYKINNPYYSYSTSNYFSLNFFSIDAPDADDNDRALIYLTPSLNRKYSEIYDASLVNTTTVSTETTPFTLDFYINCRYTNISGSYQAGTIFHIPGIISLSLVEGDNYDKDRIINNFKLLLQLGQDTANIPSTNLVGPYTTKSNLSLNKNYWYRITIRWGGEFIDNGYGSIYINDVFDSNFYYPGNIINPGSYSSHETMPIIIGNYANFNNPQNFFNKNNEVLGLTGWLNCSNPTPNFTNQLNAELHHILFSRKCYTDTEVFDFSNKLKTINKDFEILDTTLFVSGNLSNLNSKLDINNSFNIKDDDILYVIPSFWYKCKKYDEFTNNTLILTHPYNLYSSFNLGIHSLNIENFLFNFASRLVDKSLPYINGLNLTYWTINTPRGENEFFNDKKNKLRNVFLLPCDDGNFLHDASFITNEIKFQTEIINPILKGVSIKNSGNYNLIYDKSYTNTINLLKGIYSNENFDFQPGVLNLKNNLLFGVDIKNFDISGSYLDLTNDLINQFPTNISDSNRLISGSNYAIYKNTSYDIYNDFSFLNISNIFYGSSIKNNSVELIENNFLGFSKVKITLKDNGEGCLYRADSNSTNASWSKVGNVYQNEGFVSILSPMLHRFGKNDFSLSFKGNQNIYIYKITSVIPGGKINKSANTSWTSEVEENKEYVYITDVNLHDNNYNIIMKAKLAQPLYKGKNDKFMIRLKYDF